MPNRPEYETGARKLQVKQGDGPSNDFSQDAAANDPPKGIGNSVPMEESDSAETGLATARRDDDPAEHIAEGEPGTIDQKPRWEGPPESRPRGYLPAKDDPEIDRDAAGENLQDPEKTDSGDALKTRREQ